MNPNSTWTDSDWDACESWLTGLLRTNIVRVTFIKRDGSTRTMRCTRRADIVPKPVITETKRTKTATPGVLPVYDVECAGWRSFTLRNVVSIEFELGDEVEPGTGQETV